jgi:hypothetical protein
MIFFMAHTPVLYLRQQGKNSDCDFKGIEKKVFIFSLKKLNLSNVQKIMFLFDPEFLNRNKSWKGAQNKHFGVWISSVFSIRTKVIVLPKRPIKTQISQKVFFKNSKYWQITLFIGGINICEKITADVGNFRKEPWRIIPIEKTSLLHNAEHLRLLRAEFSPPPKHLRDGPNLAAAVFPSFSCCRRRDNVTTTHRALSVAWQERGPRLSDLTFVQHQHVLVKLRHREEARIWSPRPHAQNSR